MSGLTCHCIAHRYHCGCVAWWLRCMVAAVHGSIIAAGGALSQCPCTFKVLKSMHTPQRPAARTHGLNAHTIAAAPLFQQPACCPLHQPCPPQLCTPSHVL
eukprot:365327-Chlamydomonas_euryale.AAC.12